MKHLRIYDQLGWIIQSVWLDVLFVAANAVLYTQTWKIIIAVVAIEVIRSLLWTSGRALHRHLTLHGSRLFGTQFASYTIADTVQPEQVEALTALLNHGRSVISNTSAAPVHVPSLVDDITTE